MAPVRAGLGKRPRVAGAILAGGASRRFGSDKALAATPQGPLAATVLAALRGADVDPVVLIGGSDELSAALSIPTVPDRSPGEGPLAGLGSALAWASGVARLVVLPCDLPLITSDLIRLLIAEGNNQTASFAVVDGRPDVSIGCWPTHRSAAIGALLRSGERRLHAALDSGPFVGVAVPAHLIADADRPEDLAALLNPVTLKPPPLTDPETAKPPKPDVQ